MEANGYRYVWGARKSVVTGERPGGRGDFEGPDLVSHHETTVGSQVFRSILKSDLTNKGASQLSVTVTKSLRQSASKKDMFIWTHDFRGFGPGSLGLVAVTRTLVLFSNLYTPRT